MSSICVLVVYASRHLLNGGDRERIAAAMCDAAAMRRRGRQPRSTTCPATAAVVLGSAVYAKRWQRDARAFARRHDGALRDMPVWLFSSGPFGAPEQHPTAPTPPVAERLTKQLGAREHVMFGGRVPTDPGNFVERAMLKNTPPAKRDARDWPAIEAWARGVAEQVAARELAPAR